jgi:putative transposase
MDERPALAQLGEDARAVALKRFELLRAHLEDGVALTRLAQAEGIPLRTMQRWVAQYRQHGLVGLVRKERSDRGMHHFPPELVQAVEGLALCSRPPPSVASVHRQLRTIAGQRGWPAPSYATVYSLIRRLDPGLLTLAHQGSKAYKERFDLLYRREVDRPNTVWLGDHTPLDLLVRDERGKKAALRPWLTVILDDYSRAVAGYRLSLQPPSTQQTALTLRQAIWRKADPRWHVCGIPETFYTDNGSDFTSHHMEQVGIDLKMGLVFSFPGEPRGRGRIERFFETINQLFLCELPGYAPPGSRRVQPGLSLKELEKRLGSFLLEDYHHRRHGETKMAPLKRWEAGGFLPRMPESLEQLDLLLLTVAKGRKVQQDGIHFQGLRYLDLTLAAFVGETLTIRYDPFDLAEIRVFHGNRFLCRAICQELAGAEKKIGLKEIVQARSERRRELRSTLRERASVVESAMANQEDTNSSVQEPGAHPPRKGSRLKRYHND